MFHATATAWQFQTVVFPDYEPYFQAHGIARLERARRVVVLALGLNVALSWVRTPMYQC